MAGKQAPGPALSAESFPEAGRARTGVLQPHAPHSIDLPTVLPLALEPREPGRVSRLSGAAMTAPPSNDDSAASPATGAAGDDFDRFLREHHDALLGFLSRRIGDDDAQDVAQETMVRLMRYRAQPHDQLRPLMYRIAINAIHDRGRRDSSRHASAHYSLDQDFQDLPSVEPGIDQRIAHEQELVLARAAILQLPQRCRQVYLLNRIEGMSYSQIARHCDISVKAVEKHIGKALAIIRQKLKQEGVDRESGA